jgi:hypothetical protein
MKRRRSEGKRKLDLDVRLPPHNDQGSVRRPRQRRNHLAPINAKDERSERSFAPGKRSVGWNLPLVQTCLWHTGEYKSCGV